MKYRIFSSIFILTISFIFILMTQCPAGAQNNNQTNNFVPAPTITIGGEAEDNHSQRRQRKQASHPTDSKNTNSQKLLRTLASCAAIEEKGPRLHCYDKIEIPDN